MDIRTIARRIQMLRESAGLLQPDLADKIGKSPRQLQRIESGNKDISLQTLLEILQALDKTIADIFPEAQLKKDELKLLALFRAAGSVDDTRQSLIIDLVSAIASDQSQNGRGAGRGV